MTQLRTQDELQQAFQLCQKIALKSAKNFYFSFLTLPADIRRDMCVLYAYMRRCDDISDDLTIPLETRITNLHTWRKNVSESLSSQHSDDPILLALVDVVHRRSVPHAPLLEVLDGIESDLHPKPYNTFSELENYCYHVAGTVGLCCIHIWGFDSDDAPPLAIETGLAFQLTNIIRDVAEDAAMGRIYLPQEDFARFNYDPNDLTSAVMTDNCREFIRFQVHRARKSYTRSEPLSALLNPPGRPVLHAMRKIYGGLLTEIERRDYDIFSQRISLPKWKKLAYAAQSYLSHIGKD